MVVEGDFPATLFPWLVLRELGVAVRRIRPAGSAIDAEDLRRELRPETRLFCTTWVHSFRGHALDPASLAAPCRDNGTLFVLNASQGMGARPFSAASSGVDAVTSCGFKYLCGPYGTGFSWIRPDVRAELRVPKGYWLANLTADDLAGNFSAELRPDIGARAFDVYCPASFFNVSAWTASVEYLLAQGVDRIAAWDQELVSDLVTGLQEQGWQLTSPSAGPTRTTLTVFGGGTTEQTEAAFAALRTAGIFAAMRQGQLRISPHLFNTRQDIGAALDVLKAVA